uniref:MIR domain-containing protein n=1 Tax=Syphacia muris TaxID=451379 RepID=A0A0N5ADF9_9BILA
MNYFWIVFLCCVFDLVPADDNYVTCGSVIKLMNLKEGVRLHSHDVKYGSGSGQQSVTGMTEADDVNSHWQILAPLKKHCRRGEAIKCGDQIRLKHLTTGCYLHSHLFNAPLSRGNQEISCFGKNDEGDTGDHWALSCETGEWLRGEPVSLKHVDTGKYLATSGQQYGRPISGQKEIVGISSITKAALWKTAEGVYMVLSDDDN